MAGFSEMSRSKRLGLGGAALLALGIAGGAGAVQLTRPAIEMAPTVPTAVARLGDTHGVVTVRGRVAETYGDHFIVQDASGRALVAGGRPARSLKPGAAVLVQGRYDDGQLRARYLVDAAGNVEEAGPPPPPPHRGPPPPPGAGAPPPPPGAGAPPPPAGADMPAPPPPPANVAAGSVPPPAAPAKPSVAPAVR